VVGGLGALEDNLGAGDRVGGLDGIGEIGPATGRALHRRARAGDDRGLDTPARESGDDGSTGGPGPKDDMACGHGSDLQRRDIRTVFGFCEACYRTMFG
jgi:hypothetical protein